MSSTFADQLELEFRTQLSLFALHDHEAAVRESQHRLGHAK